MIIASTASQWMHEARTLTAVLVTIACVAYLARRLPTALQKRGRELLDQGIATGFVVKRAKSRYRFRLLDLLVIVTLIVAVAGAFRGMANTERVGIPYTNPIRSALPDK